MFLNSQFYGSNLYFYKFYSTKRLTNVQRNSFSVPQHLHEIIIGCSLGDLHIYREYTNSRLRFLQGLINEAYILHLYDLFEKYCSKGPTLTNRKPDLRTGNIYTQVYFSTYCLPCFNYYYELFYVDGVKRIPLNIGELLTPVSLAYWAMDDGSKINSGLTFCTDSFSLSEVELLIGVFKENFDLNCTINKNKGNYRIYVKADSMDKFRALVTPHFHQSMLYKLAEK